MKLKVLVVSMAAFLVFAGSAEARYVAYPTAHEHEAERHALHSLHRLPGWRYRQEGYLDCQYGRINRYTWACRVAWRHGYSCRVGRIRIENEYVERNIVYFRVNLVTRRCR